MKEELKMAKTLVLYYSATGTTKRVAETIAQQLGADIQAIHAAQPYTAADLDWHDPQSRTSIEQHQHNCRVAVQDDLPDLAGYDNVVIGHPIWWGIPPRMIASVVDHLDLTGKNLALFATSGGSSYRRSQAFIERTIKENGYQVNLGQGDVITPQQVGAWLKKQPLAW